jgi:hypothetical protein
VRTSGAPRPGNGPSLLGAEETPCFEETFHREMDAMGTTYSTAAALGALAVAATLGAASYPAEAGQVCDGLSLSSPCVRSDDLRARINLDQDGTNGLLRVRDADGDDAVALNASTATLTNLFDNAENKSNGVVKAWAQINANGTIEACWRCNIDTAETNRVATGEYHVDFTPLSTDISGRPRSATIDNLTGNQATPGAIDLADLFSDPSTVVVHTANVNGVDSDRPFVLIIY